MTIQQAATILSVSESWVRARCGGGIRGARLVGARWEISAAALAKLRRLKRPAGRQRGWRKII